MEMAVHQKPIGIFGHTHRHKLVNTSHERKCSIAKVSQVCTSDFIEHQLAVLIDSGSIGQPRNNEKVNTVLILTKINKSVNVEFVQIPYEYKAHIDAIQCASLSNETKQKLINFFPI